MRKRIDKKRIMEQARSTVANAIKNGTLAKPDVCSICGKSGRIHGHHHKGYDFENWLDVQWVCVKCHVSLDGRWAQNPRPKMVCKICGKPARRLELCETHRTRFRRYGDPLIRRVKTTGEKWILIREAA